jgi:hypothetical protein
MKRLLLLLLLAAAPCFAQSSPNQNILAPSASWPIPYSGVPTGLCLSQQTAVNTSNGNFYTCNGGVWQIVSGSGGIPAGSNGQIQFNFAGVFGGVNGSLVNSSTGAISLTASANNVTPFSVGSFSSSQTAPVVDFHNAGSGTTTAAFGVRGFGFGSFGTGSNTSLWEFQTDSDAASNFAWVAHNRQNAATIQVQASNAGVVGLCGGNAGGDGNYACSYFDLGGNGGVTNEVGPTGTSSQVPATSAQLVVGETADLHDFKNSTGTVAHVDKNGNFIAPMGQLASVLQCGTIAAGGACSNTTTTLEHCIAGIATLSAGTSTITGISPAFTSSSTFYVTTNDVTTIANLSKGTPASASSITFTGTGTDNIQFIACGG